MSVENPVSVLNASSLSHGPSARATQRLVPQSLGRRFRLTRTHLEPAIQQMTQFADRTGLPLMCVDVSSGLVLTTTNDDFVELLPEDTFNELIVGSFPRVVESTYGLTFFAISLPDLDGLQTIGIGYVLNPTRSSSDQLQSLREELGWSEAALHEWQQQQETCSTKALTALIRFETQSKTVTDEASIEFQKLRRNKERLVDQVQFLQRTLMQLAISQNSDNLTETCLDGLEVLTATTGSVILWEQSGQRRVELTHGRIPVSTTRLPLLIEQCGGDGHFDSMVMSKIHGTLLGADFPGVNSLLLSPIREGARVTGWLCLFNRDDGYDFDQNDIVLADIVATLIVTHARNREVYEAHDELLLQFVGSLVTTIDAKDSYTRGHSERVAAISRAIAHQMGLSKRDLEDCFNAGLLHDIGKIGVNDAVLQKTEALTSEEYDHIKQHPMIGYRILRGLKSMHRLLPGIRNHHEEFAGTGYPDRLKGHEIPLLARILAVADSYDAMRSDRPYRRGMPLSQVDHIFRAGTGRQWDPDVIAAYFAAHSDIRKIGGPEIWSDEPETN